MPVDPIGELTDERFLISMDGVTLDVPPRWEARISRSAPDPGTGDSFPVAHAATIPLPSQRGDYGSNVVERLGPEDIFVSLVEFGPESVDTPLFPRVADIPASIDPAQFGPRQLQRVIPGQAGKQLFFTYGDRAFCLYVVLGSYARRAALATTLTSLLSQLSIEPRSSQP